MDITNLNEIMELNEFIIKSFDTYDNAFLKYKDFILSDNIHINYSQNELTITLNNDPDNVHYKYFELLGFYDINNRTWIWAWSIYINNDIIKISKELLNYGLKMEPGLYPKIEFSFIKSLLVNSRILIETDVEFNCNLAIIFYLLKNKCSFIMSHDHYLDDVKFLRYYYIVK